MSCSFGFPLSRRKHCQPLSYHSLTDLNRKPEVKLLYKTQTVRKLGDSPKFFFSWVLKRKGWTACILFSCSDYIYVTKIHKNSTQIPSRICTGCFPRSFWIPSITGSWITICGNPVSPGTGCPLSKSPFLPLQKALPEGDMTLLQALWQGSQAAGGRSTWHTRRGEGNQVCSALGGGG